MLNKAVGASPEDRLKSLGLKLPPVPTPVADYVTHSQIGSMIYTSGMLPWVAGDLKFVGKMGAELTAEDGYKAFQLSALNGFALLKSIVGELSRIRRIHRIEGTGGATSDFFEMPSALNGASHLVNSIFEERGKHSRMIYSNPSMPLNCATLLVFWAEIEH